MTKTLTLHLVKQYIYIYADFRYRTITPCKFQPYPHQHILVGGLEHVWFFHILGIVIPIDELRRWGETTNQYSNPRDFWILSQLSPRPRSIAAERSNGNTAGRCACLQGDPPPLGAQGGARFLGFQWRDMGSFNVESPFWITFGWWRSTPISLCFMNVYETSTYSFHRVY